MNKFTKGLLTVSVLAAMSLMAADDETIYVTTFADEDGENPAQCSLREAVTAASTHQPYGGCSRGDRYPTNVKKIQLEAGTYNLTRELQPNATLYIMGKAPEDYSKPDAVNNDYPAITEFRTTISGQGASRIFNTTNLNKPGLTLQDVILDGGMSTGPGGALLLGGGTELNNVVIQNSKAERGGAIFLNDINSPLNIVNSVIKNNQANFGSALAMTCLDGLNYTARKIDVLRSSVLSNGNSNSQSTLAFCGQATTSIEASTISQNVAQSGSGHIIQFSTMNGDQPTNLSPNSSLTLKSNTIVKNNAATVLLYDVPTIKNLSYNVIGFNAGLGCKFNPGGVENVDSANISTEKNALNLTQNDLCQLPKTAFEHAKTNSLDLNGVAFESVLSPLQENKEYTNFRPMYFPIENASGFDLVDVSGNNCSQYDQRGIKRVLEASVDGLSNVKNTCDIGSTEVLRLTAENISEVNPSVVTLIESYEENYKLFKDLVENKETKPEYLPYYQLRRDEFDQLIKFTKSDQKYRTIFANPFAVNLPEETIMNDGARKIQHLNKDNYNVEVKALGVGKIGSDGLFIGQADERLKCEWNANLSRIMLYRTDDRVTADSDYEICQYTLISKVSGKRASAYLQGRFTNINPIVPTEKSVTVEHGGAQRVNVDLLSGASDDGDGLVSALATPNKSPFYLNQNGETQAIRITDIPNAVSVYADRSGPCPGLDSKYTCYGGNVSMQLNNSLDVFSYPVKYVVYDADGLPSNQGTLKLSNTATQSGSVRSSGGGAIGWLGLLGLLGLATYRARVTSRKSGEI